MNSVSQLRQPYQKLHGCFCSCYIFTGMSHQINYENKLVKRNETINILCVSKDYDNLEIEDFYSVIEKNIFLMNHINVLMSNIFSEFQN